MTKRGKVLRDTTSGPGLLMIEGQQHRFVLEEMWKSEAPPKPGLVVDVELDARGRVQSITVVPESWLAREQAEATLALARQKGHLPITRTSLSNLLAVGLLAVAWFFLTAASIPVPFPGKLGFTFWQILGFLNASNVPELLDGRSSPSAGVYGFAAIVVLAGPLLQHLWKDKWALLGGLLPLAFMVIVGIAVRSSIQSALGSGQDVPMKAVSLGPGTYLSILVGLYFAFTSAKGLLVANASERQGLKATPRKAA